MMNFEVVETKQENAKIKVVGVGGGGGNAILHMINHDIKGVDFICANTDTQALKSVKSATTIKLGNGLTKGLGAGADPDIGRRAAESDRMAIEELLSGADMVFITAGMGGGTGTGAAPVIASIAKELGALTVAVVTKPFKFEGKKRMGAAEKGLASLVEEVDSLVTIPNEKLFEILGLDTSMQDAFAKSDDVLKGAVQGISDIIMQRGHVNVDFADVKAVMSEKGIAMMGTGIASGKNRAEAAATMAVKSELLDDINLKNARGVLVNITGKEPTLRDQAEVADIIDEIVAVTKFVIPGPFCAIIMDISPVARVYPSAIMPADPSCAQSQNLMPACGNKSEIGIMAEPMIPNACSIPCICRTFTNASSVVIFMNATPDGRVKYAVFLGCVLV